MSAQDVTSQSTQDFQKALDHLKHDYGALQVGRASAALVENIEIEAYGIKQPLKVVASISIPDSSTIQIQPWDKSVINNINKAITSSELNLNPINEGSLIRISIPPLTEERRQELSKVVRKLAEDTKISIRNSRQNAYHKIKELEKNKEITEDEMHSSEKEIQGKVDDANKQIDEIAQKKEQDIMSI